MLWHFNFTFKKLLLSFLFTATFHFNLKTFLRILMVNFLGFVRPVLRLNIWLLYLQLFSPSLLTRPLFLVYSMSFLFIQWPAVNLHSVLLCLVTFNQWTSSSRCRLNQHLLSFSLHPHCFTFNSSHSSLSPVPSYFCSPAASRSFTDSSQIIGDGGWGAPRRAVLTPKNSTIFHLRPRLYLSHLLFFPPGSSHFAFSLIRPLHR